MEGMVGSRNKQSGNGFWQDRRVFVTGCTGYNVALEALYDKVSESAAVKLRRAS